MKPTFTLCVFCLIFAAGRCFSQTPTAGTDTLPEPFVFSDTVSVGSASRGELYERALNWYTSRYKSAPEVPRKQQRNTQPLGTKAWHDIHIPTELGSLAVKMFYTLEIRVTDGAYWYRVGEVHYQTYSDPLVGNPVESFTAETIFGKQGYQPNGDVKPLTERYLASTETYFGQLLHGLTSAMSREAIVATK
ncbi:MAG: DUF4468 domain-containing protein [Ferruginibacter sp.]|nr:DUF4468 domain-containing protein [Cytophagales bacterium]